MLMCFSDLIGELKVVATFKRGITRLRALINSHYSVKVMIPSGVNVPEILMIKELGYLESFYNLTDCINV